MHKCNGQRRLSSTGLLNSVSGGSQPADFSSNLN